MTDLLLASAGCVLGWLLYRKIHGSEVGHGTFLTSIPLITHAVQQLTGALGQ